ncbi:hypothetical protein CYMTET_25824, partial [Cymbomonas tetramitiformis]
MHTLKLKGALRPALSLAIICFVHSVQFLGAAEVEDVETSTIPERANGAVLFRCLDVAFALIEAAMEDGKLQEAPEEAEKSTINLKIDDSVSPVDTAASLLRSLEHWRQSSPRCSEAVLKQLLSAAAEHEARPQPAQLPALRPRVLVEEDANDFSDSDSDSYIQEDASNYDYQEDSSYSNDIQDLGSVPPPPVPPAAPPLFTSGSTVTIESTVFAEQHLGQSIEEATIDRVQLRTSMVLSAELAPVTGLFRVVGQCQGGGECEISGDARNRIFSVSQDSTLQLEHLVLRHGHAARDGGAVWIGRRGAASFFNIRFEFHTAG